jgi:hypothetical protein
MNNSNHPDSQIRNVCKYLSDNIITLLWDDCLNSFSTKSLKDFKHANATDETGESTKALKDFKCANATDETIEVFFGDDSCYYFGLVDPW